jgi:hypothetical protein
MAYEVRAYEVRIEPEARAVLNTAPQRSRLVIERKLKEAARIAALREWQDHAEVREPFRLELAGFEGSYSLDPSTRQLTLWHLVRRTDSRERTG